jgi:sulfite exporter TauE/SafE
VNLVAVLLTGLLAGGVSCAAVQGGLLAGLVARQRGDDTRTPARSGQGAGRAVPPQKPWTARLADDLAPIGGFLAGKLVSHTILGALLGTLGTVVQLSPNIRAVLQLAAGVLIVVFGLAQLGVPGFRRVALQPPAALARFVRGRARSQSALAPGLLGLATVLIPCGVTLSVEALALTSGSALAGAVTMAVFVVGTSPLFAALGYLARKAATVWRGRLALATGLLVIGLGLYTFNGGLTVLDSPLAAANLPRTLGLAAPPATAETVTATGSRQTAVVTATASAYSPGNTQLKAGVPTTLIVRAANAAGCIRAFVINNKQYILPENGDVRIDLGTLAPGRIDYRCGMGMYSGQLTVVP